MSNMLLGAHHSLIYRSGEAHAIDDACTYHFTLLSEITFGRYGYENKSKKIDNPLPPQKKK